MKNVFLLSSILFLLLFSCSSKKSDNDPSVQDLLVSGIWTITLQYEDLDLDGNFDEFGDACDKDDRWDFGSDGILKFDNGPVLCDPDDDPNLVITINWELSNDEQYLTLKFTFDESRYFIESIDEHELILFLVEPGNTSGVYQNKMVLQR